LHIPSDSPSVARFVLITMLIFVAAVLVVFRALEQTADSLEYARSIRSGSNLFHPHHLLFNPVIRCFWKGTRAAFPSADPLTAGQVHNLLWALIMLASVFLIIRRMTGSSGAAVVFALALFAMVGFWQYATFVEVYIPSMGCLAVILALLYVPRSKPRGLGMQAAVVALFVLAILYNQMAVLFLPALAVFWTPRYGFREIRRTAGLIAAAGGVVLAAYVAAFFTTSHPRTAAGFVHWCLSYAFNPDPTWGSFGNISLIGMSKLFLSFARDVLFIPRTLLMPAAVAAGLICGALTFLILRSIARRKPESNLRIALFLWVFLAAAFMWWFSPAGHELSIPLLLPILFLIVRLSADAWESAADPRAVRRRLIAGAAVVAACVFIVNLAAVILPAHASRGIDYSRAVLVQKSVPAGAAIFADFWLVENLRYYFDRSDAIIDVDVLYSFYRFMELKPDMIPGPRKPVVVSAEFLSHDTKPGGIFGGDVQPREWQAFIEWICGCEIRNGRVIAARTPSAIADLPGYLLLSGERHPVDGLADVFRRLDEAMSVAAPSFSGSFSAWLRRHPERSR